MNGEVIIGITADSKKLEKKLNDLKKELSKYEQDAEKLANTKIKAEADLNSYKEAIKDLGEMTNKELKLAESEQERNQILKANQGLLDEINQKYSPQIEKYNEINRKIQENVTKQNDVKNKIKETNSQLAMSKGFDKLKLGAKEFSDNLKGSVSKSINGISKKIDNIGKSVGGVTKKILKWGLALFGIRTAYNLIRQAVSTVSQNNEGLANQIQFMKNVIATALEPVIKRIISLLYTLMSFLNSIITKLTGKNLFEAAKKNMQSGAKSAKEIKKQLAGFDEMNILSDSSSSKDSGFDTSGFEGIDSGLMDILDKFKKMFEEGDWAGIAQTISKGIVDGLNWLIKKIKSIDWSGIGIKISEFLTNIDFSGILVGLVSVFGEAVIGFQNLLLAIDWATVLSNFGTGIANAIGKIYEYLQLIDWAGIGAKLSEAFVAVPWGDIGINILNTLWASLLGIVDLFLGIDWAEVGKSIGGAVQQWINTIVDMFIKTDWEQLGKDIIDAIFNFIENVDWLQLANDMLTGLASGIVAAIRFVISAFGELLKRILEFFGIHSPSTVFANVGKNIMEGLINGLKALFNNVVAIFNNIVAKIKSAFSTVVNWLKNNIINPIMNLFKEIGVKAGDVISGAFKGVVNGVLKAIETILNGPINAINALIKTINKVPGINIGKLSTFKLPKLAKGGIINQPGRGIPIASAIGGERGAEGVIPLTDSQQMALIGEAIGKYVTINATIPVYAYNRQVDKQIKRIKAEDDFAFNR